MNLVERNRHLLLPNGSISPSLQNKIVKDIYSKPDDRRSFDVINSVCFEGTLHSIHVTICKGLTTDISKCSYDSSTKRFEISFSDRLKILLGPEDFFLAYIHQLLHAYTYVRLRVEDIDQASDHGLEFKYKLQRIQRIFSEVYLGEYKGLECLAGKKNENGYYCVYCVLRPVGYISTDFLNSLYADTNKNIVEIVSDEPLVINNPRGSTSGTTQKKTAPLINETTPTNVQSTNKQTVPTGNTKTASSSHEKSSVPTNKIDTVNPSSNPANVPNKTTPKNVQLTKKQTVTGNTKTASSSDKKSSVPTNKINTINSPSNFDIVSNKTIPTNVQNKNIASSKPLQGNCNTVSIAQKKALVPVNKNNIVSSSSNSASFPITTTLTNSHGDKIVSITATKQSTVIVIHQD
ncbi:uncharacterized protein LOC106650810 [Trichogramma pretiosum]|uniref:uncharacterized protein LOC106650810 n=1 Tax=Trichogramma pretiosum TaxID=7493 RepID=UPI0006C940DF|nr:uncharacterized protein LOC106650810 [Trichogramma pretiosum]XP_014224511.1 uncharacterized protein LOC106650810 [Trichogramma pretiosum]